MDEDYGRAHSQYIKAIGQLHGGLKKRGVRTIMWNDSAFAETCANPPRCPLVFAEKARAAEKKMPKDIVQIVWDYGVARPKIVRRLVRQGFEVWGAPGGTAEKIQQWRDVLLRHGGKGLLMTQWLPCRKSNRAKLLDVIRNAGAVL